MSPLAHGIGVVRDLPIPAVYFFVGAVVVLVASFVLLVVLWRRPLLEAHADGRRLPAPIGRVVLSRAVRVLLGAVSVGLLVLTLSTALFGTTVVLLNFAPTFVYITFWLGLPLLSILFGNVWSVLSPWRSLADATVWLLDRSGREARPVLEWSGAWGRYPAAAALFAFVALELAHPQPDYPRTLAIAIALYSYWALAGMAVFGRDAWTRHGEGFAVAFGLLARIAPFAARNGSVVVRWPFTGLAGDDRVRGTLAFVGVLLGSTAFDGFSRTSTWSDLLTDLRRELATSSQRVVDLATTFLNIGGLTLLIVVILAAYLAAVAAAQAIGRVDRSLVPDFVLPLVPIAAAYLVAHYFTLFIREGQFIITLVSDPFGRGWDLFGTADYAPNLAPVSPETVWYVQVAALVVGHVAGLAVAHDRAVAVFEGRRRTLEAQLPMLALMVLYTLGGMWLLTRG
ncbi:MAG: fenitrothion hydrolase [Gaiellaceae bacterium]